MYSEVEEWDDNVEHLEQFSLASGVADIDQMQKRRAVFLSIVGNKIKSIFLMCVIINLHILMQMVLPDSTSKW